MYVIDYDAIDEARGILDIKCEVEIWWRYMRYASGRYHHRPNGKHRITISNWFKYYPLDASQILWHELTHAQQSERLGGGDAFADQYWAEFDEAGISRTAINYGKPLDKRIHEIPLELEAIANEVRADELQLVKWVRKKKLKTINYDMNHLLGSI